MARRRVLFRNFQRPRITIAAPPVTLVLVLLVAGFGCSTASADAGVPAGQRILHQTWTFKDGAPETVTSVAQTVDGFLWLGAPAGLFRFDGVRFEPFRSQFGDQLLSTYVFTLFVPPTDGLWVGYAFGGFSFVKNGRVNNFDLNTGTVYGFAQDKEGIVWAATSSGLWRFDGSVWQHITADWNAPVRPICQVRFDHDGILWVLIDSFRPDVGKGLLYLPPGTRQFRNAGRNLFIEGFTLDTDNIVLTTPKDGRQVGSAIQLEESLPAYPLLKQNSDQVLDRNNGIWSFPQSGSVLRHQVDTPFPEDLSKVSPLNSEAYKIEQVRYAHLIDREGSLWVGDVKGVHRFSYTPLVSQEFAKSEGGPLFAVAPDENGTVWITTGNGNDVSHLYRVANGKAELKKSRQGSNVAYRGIDKSLWIAGDGGLWHIVNGSITKVDLPPDIAANARSFQSITQERSGAIWVSVQGAGLYRYSAGVWQPNGGRPDLPKGVVIGFTDKLGRVWFGYTKSRLAVLDGGVVKKFGPSDGLRIGNVTAIQGRGSKIWIGGEFGLQQFDNKNFHNIEAVQKEWLRGISGIVETENGDLWLNALGGILHITRSELANALADPAHQVTGERFGRREGLPGLSQQLNPLLTAVEGTDGRIWFTGTSGVVWLNPAQASNRIPPAPVAIEYVSADGKGYALDQPLKFPAHTADVLISYAAVSLKDPEAIRYRYRLQETDNAWHDLGTSTSVTYRNLAPGPYHFQVTASDANGMWSDKSAIVAFAVLPAFYQTNWFRALCGIMLLGLLWAAYQFRVRQLHHQFEMSLNARVGERTRIARELHDTLLQSFHGLLLRFQTVSQLLPDRPVDAKDKLDGAIKQAAEAITEGRDAVQALRDSTLQRNDLALAISTLGKELATESASGEQVKFQVTVEGEARELHPIVRDEIYKIAAESLRNAFKHAQASQVEVEIRYDDEQFRLRVRDDGKGIEPAVLSSVGVSGHFGLHGMQERAKLIGGTLTIWSEVAAGTELELRLPARAAYSTGRKNSWLSRKFAAKA